MRAKGGHSGFLNHFSMLCFLRQGLSLNLNLLQLDWLASDSLEDQPMSISGAVVRALCCYARLFYGAGDLSSSPRACVASTLITEASLQSPFFQNLLICLLVSMTRPFLTNNEYYLKILSLILTTFQELFEMIQVIVLKFSCTHVKLGLKKSLFKILQSGKITFKGGTGKLYTTSWSLSHMGVRAYMV